MRFIPRPEPGEFAPYFEGLPEAALTRIGTANGSPMSVRAGAFHIAGHEFHHLDSIEVNYGGGSRP